MHEDSVSLLVKFVKFEIIDELKSARHWLITQEHGQHRRMPWALQSHKDGICRNKYMANFLTVFVIRIKDFDWSIINSALLKIPTYYTQKVC